jgi:hypothetical protein
VREVGYFQEFVTRYRVIKIESDIVVLLLCVVGGGGGGKW